MNDDFDFSHDAPRLSSKPAPTLDAERDANPLANPLANPYATPTDLNDSDFYFEEREAEEGGPQYGRVRWKTLLSGAARLFFGNFAYFVATFAVALGYFAAVWSAVFWAAGPPLWFWCAIGVAGGPLSLLGRKTALRLAKTGSIFRRENSLEPRFFSARYLGRGVLGSTALVGGFFGFVATLAYFGNRYFWIGGFYFAGAVYCVAFGAAACFAILFAFFPFFLAEYKIGVFKAFRWSTRYHRKTLPFFVSFFLLSIAELVGAAALLDLNAASDAAAFASMTFLCATFYVEFSALAPVAYLLATGRRLSCEQEEPKQQKEQEK